MRNEINIIKLERLVDSHVLFLTLLYLVLLVKTHATILHLYELTHYTPNTNPKHIKRTLKYSSPSVVIYQLF